MSEKTIDQQFIEYIIKSLVSKPDAVVVDRIIDEKGVLLTLTVDPEDLGRVIGKRGATAQSLRTLLRALGTKQEARFNLKIFDNGVPKPEREHRETSNSGWNSGTQTDSETSVKEESKENNNDSTDSSTTEDTSPTADTEDENRESTIERTRRELEDLDDLDV